MNNRLLPPCFTVKPLALLIPIASVAILSSAVSAAVGIDDSITGPTSTYFVSGTGINSLTVTNSGMISPNSIGNAVTIGVNATLSGGIVNAGSIAAGYSGIGIFVEDGASVGSIANSGTIVGLPPMTSPLGAVGSGIVLGSSTVASITNFGTITGDIELIGDAEVTGLISNQGSIEGSVQAFGTGTMSMPSIEKLVNAGTIEGVNFYSGASVGEIFNNTNGIIGGGSSSVGISISSGASVQTITNSGFIEGGTAESSYPRTGIYISGESTIVGSITNTGTITSNNSISNSYSSYNGRAISISSSATIGSLVNGGTIDGNIDITSGAQVNVEINNSGLINGEIYISDYSYTSSAGTYSGELASIKTSIGSLKNSGTITAGIFVENSEVSGDVTNDIGGEILAGISFDRASLGGDLINAGLITETFNGDGYEKIVSAISINGGHPEYSLATEIPTTIELSGKIINQLTGRIANTAEDVVLLPSQSGFAKPSAERSDPAAIYLNYVNMSYGIKNQGLISSTNGTGIRVENGFLANIFNSGTITGGNGYAIFIDDTAGVGLMDNTGIINGAVSFGANGGNYLSTEGIVGDITMVSDVSITGGTAGDVSFLNGGNFTAIGGSIGNIINASNVLIDSTVVGNVTLLGGGKYRTRAGTAGTILNANIIEVGASTNGGNSVGALVSKIEGDLTFSATLLVEVTGFSEGVSYGQLDVSGNANIDGADLVLNVTGDDFFSHNEALVLLKADSLISDIDSAIEGSVLLDFYISEQDNSLIATVKRGDIGDIVLIELQELAAAAGVDINSSGVVNTVQVAAALNDIAALIDSGDIAEDSELGIAVAQLQAITDPVSLVRAIQSLEPESGGGSSEGATAAAGAATSVISNRQASIRNSIYETGMVAGDDVSITGFWIQGYDKDTEQEIREGIDGFDVDMYGVAIGADGPINETTTIGIAISYADSQVDSTGIENNDMSIDSYQISGYVSFNEEEYYLDAVMSYSLNNYDGNRYLFNGEVASADYSGDQYGLRARGGYPFVFESGLHMIPNTSVEYSYLKEEGYQEEGAGNLGNNLDSQSLEALVWAAGVKFAYPFTTASDTTWMPDFHMEVRHDFIADEVEIDTNFIGAGGAGFSINGSSVERTAYKAGVGLRAWSQSDFSFMFRYDYLYKKDYKSQAVAATMRYSF
jgi:uncharacterized protein with beta-barrel porin domain